MRRLLLVPLLVVLALAAAPRVAQAAVPGVNVVGPSLSETTWTRIAQSKAKTVRVWIYTSQIQTNPAMLGQYTAMAARLHGLGATPLITILAAPGSNAPPNVAAYAATAGQIAAALRGQVAGYEIWNEEDDAPFWANPSAAAYAALLRATYPAIKAQDPGAPVVIGGLVGNDYDFLQDLYANGAKGAFDVVGVHTDTACVTADPSAFYREANGRIGRFSFTGYREVHQTELANGDDKPIWMTEIGWATTSASCNTGASAGKKAGGVSDAQQAQYLTKAYSCLAADPYVQQALWFSLADYDSGSANYDLRLGLLDDKLNPKPAFSAFESAGSAKPQGCGASVDKSAPTVTISAPKDGGSYLAALPIKITASDDQGVTKIQLLVDGKAIPTKTKISGSGASCTLDWQGAKRLAYGPHTIVAKAYDAAKNVATATIKVTHVGGGGAYKLAVATKLRITLSKLKHRKLTITGRVVPSQKVATVQGKTQILVARKDGRRWKVVSRYGKGKASKTFKIPYTFKKAGTYRITATFTPKKGSPFKKSSWPARTLRVA